MKKILGIGNALVDILVNIEDDKILSEYGLDKGGMVMIDADRKREIHEAIQNMEQACATGGSTSNTIHGLARLGAPAGYIGKVGHDKMGDFFKSEMQRFDVTPHLIDSNIYHFPPLLSTFYHNYALLFTKMQVFYHKKRD